MSHGIERRDVVLAVGTTAWHGLALSQAEAFDLERVLLEPSFGFEVKLAQSGLVSPLDGAFLTVDGDRYTCRVSPEGEVFPFGRVKDGYTPFCQEKAIETAREIEQRLGGSLRFDTAGTLFNGARCWLQAVIEDQAFEVRTKLGAKFPHAARFTFLWGHDGKTPVIFKGNQVCVVCWNTTEVAIGEKGGEIRIAHTSSVEEQVKAAVRYLTELPGTLAENAAVLQAFADTPMSLPEFEEFATCLILGVDHGLPVDERRDRIARELEAKRPLREGGLAKTTRALSLFENALEGYRAEFLRRADQDGAGRSLFSAESAVTALVDHPTAIQDWLKARKAGYRQAADAVKALSKAADSALFGSGATLKRRARAMLLRAGGIETR